MHARHEGCFGSLKCWQESNITDWALPWITPPSLSPITQADIVSWGNWPHLSWQITPFSSSKHGWPGAAFLLKVSGRGKRSSSLWGNCGYASGRLHWICLWMRLQDQHKLHCRPKHVFPRCFGLCLSPWYALLSFLPPLLAGQPQAGPHQWFSEDVGACLKCCFAIWGASAGRRCRRGEEEKKEDLEAQKTSLYVEEMK